MQDVVHGVENKPQLRVQHLPAPQIDVSLNHDQQGERIPKEQEVERIVHGVRGVQPSGIVHMERKGHVFRINKHLVDVFSVPDNVQDVRENNSAESAHCLVVPQDHHCARH